jgi:hypothetical protein
MTLVGSYIPDLVALGLNTTGTYCSGCDIFQLGATIYCSYWLADGAGGPFDNTVSLGMGYIFFMTAATPSTLVVKLDFAQTSTLGYVYDSKYYFVASKSTAFGYAATARNLYYFNGTTLTLSADYSSYISNIECNKMVPVNSPYIRTAYFELISCAKLIWRSDTTTNFNTSPLTYGGVAYSVICSWNSTGTVDWIFYKYSGYIHGFYFNSKGIPFLLKYIHSFSNSYWLMGSANGLILDLGTWVGSFTYSLYGKITKTAMTTDVICIPKIDTQNYVAVAQLFNYPLDDEEGIFLFNDDDSLLFFGYPDTDYIKANTSAEEGLRLISPMNADMTATYSGTFTAGTAPEAVISTIIGTTKFCTVGTLDASGLTLTAAIPYSNMKKADIITDMLKIMARCVEINSALAITSKSIPTSSTKTLTFETISNTSSFAVESLSRKKTKASSVKLRYGPSLTLYEKRGTAANEYEIQDIVPQFTSITDVERHANSLLSSSIPYYEIVISVVGNGKFTAGQTLVFSYSPESVPEETYYIVAENYNSLSGVAQLRILSLIRYNLKSLIQQIQTQLDTVTTTANNAVVKTGDETIAGIKTFTSFPITPNANPTTALQVANKQYADDNFLKNRAICYLLKRKNQTIAHNTTTPVSFNGTANADYEVSDLLGWHDQTTNPTRITPNIAGWYRATAKACFASNATGYRIIWFDGSLSHQPSPTLQLYLGMIYLPAVNGDITYVSASSSLIYFNGTGDYIEMKVVQSSGGSLALNGLDTNAAQITEFVLELITPALRSS